MKGSYVEGLAPHSGPESYVVARKGKGEALTGIRAARVLTRESNVLRRMLLLPRTFGASGPKVTNGGTFRRTGRKKERIDRPGEPNLLISQSMSENKSFFRLISKDYTTPCMSISNEAQRLV